MRSNNAKGELQVSDVGWCVASLTHGRNRYTQAEINLFSGWQRNSMCEVLAEHRVYTELAKDIF
ncbi:hypothetical protein [Pontibacter sp. SGAir0037]|uniref:hypothetical protein n=1 Tax=Pontibacter sp. SGAir0037 TaxID=2571030 RepID=UPI0010CD3325|nr:hypothetical protein [Pontibacter sp. SGAir0037]QCR22412.1 hypothetical protein C1N53_08730 [Pontibacter sp. SGAir0037]